MPPCHAHRAAMPCARLILVCCTDGHAIARGGEEGCESREVRGEVKNNKHELLLNMGKEGVCDGGGGECDYNETRASAMMS